MNWFWSQNIGTTKSNIYPDPETPEIEWSTSNANVGDIVLHDSETNRIFSTESLNYNTTTYPVPRYTPIGIVVVPPLHNLYGDGSGAMVSLRWMSPDTPEYGSVVNTEIAFGLVNQTINEIINYNTVYAFDTVAQNTADYYNDAYFPSDYFSGQSCNKDRTSGYIMNVSPLIDSPYLSKSTGLTVHNADYLHSGDNVLLDIYGEVNTNILVRKSQQSDWKTADTITNLASSTLAPSACCCKRYKTSGTKSGDWYLPSAGEMGYLMARLQTIDSSISRCQGSTINTILSLQTSSVIKNAIWIVDSTNGHLSPDGSRGFFNTNTIGVRAFAKIR